MEFVVTLIHGTFAPKAPWTASDSLLCQEFNRQLGSAVKFRSFVWSGKNSFKARSVATEELRDFLWEGVRLFPDATHAIIAHSHGGNLVLYAFRDVALQRHFDSVVCLSTPFLTAYPRDFGTSMQISTFGALAIAVIAFVGAFIKVFEAESIEPSRLAALVAGWVFTGVCYVMYVLLSPPISKWVSFVKQLQEELELSSTEYTRLLVIRASGDEASGLLGSAQFLGWLTTKCFAGLGAIADRFFGERVKASMTPHKMNASIILESMKAFLLAAFGALLVLLVLPVFVFVLFLSLLPFSFSPVAAFLAVTLQINVDATPPGKCVVLQMQPAKTGFKHSVTYQSEVAINAAYAWISRRQRSNEQASEEGKSQEENAEHVRSA
jgi:hypothetical protein